MMQKPIFARPACALIVLALIALVAEIVLRYGFGLGNPPLSVADSRYEYMFRPGQRISRFGRRILINNFGMRSEPMTRVRQGTHRRVLVFGDSVVFGGSQVDQSLIATSLLQASLRETHPNAEVGNVSAGSWGPGNWRAWAEAYGFFDATDILLVVSSHDAKDNPTFEPLNPNTHPTKAPLSAIGELVTRYANLDRLIYQLQSWHFIPDKNSQLPSTHTRHPTLITSSGDNPALVQGLSDLRVFLKLAQSSGARVSVIQFWERSELQQGKPLPKHSAINALLNELQIPVIQSSTVFQDCSHEPAIKLYVDNIHPYTLDGQACLARAMMKALVALNKSHT